jgi:hypothetical protein
MGGFNTNPRPGSLLTDPQVGEAMPSSESTYSQVDLRLQRCHEERLDRLLDVRLKQEIQLYGCKSPSLGSRHYYLVQFIVRMETWRLSPGNKANAPDDSLGSGYRNFSRNAVSLVVAQSPQSLCSPTMVEEAFHASSVGSISIDLAASSDRRDAGRVH